MGRKKDFVRRDFSVAPAGAFSVVNLETTARAVGYYRALLRSLERGKRRSRWGWWLVAVCKDFQRQRAAARVAANRKVNAGDSMWLVPIPENRSPRPPQKNGNLSRKNVNLRKINVNSSQININPSQDNILSSWKNTNPFWRTPICHG